MQWRRVRDGRGGRVARRHGTDPRATCSPSNPRAPFAGGSPLRLGRLL